MYSNIVDSINSRVPTSESEYLGDDGLLHCSNCGEPVQVEVEFAGIKKTVRCVCRCKSENDDFETQQKRDEQERKRRICFADTNMASWTFQNDDRKNEKLSNAMQKYVNDFTEHKKNGQGLLLYGPVGTGKTYLAACIANALIDNDQKVRLTTFTDLIDQKFKKHDINNELNKNALLIFDDLGVERQSEFMEEQVFNIIDTRYKTGLPFIVTTNLSIEDIKKPTTIMKARIYDRVLEKCFPVEVAGVSRRRQNVKDNYHITKEKLGL